MLPALIAPAPTYCTVPVTFLPFVASPSGFEEDPALQRDPAVLSRADGNRPAAHLLSAGNREVPHQSSVGILLCFGMLLHTIHWWRQASGYCDTLHCAKNPVCKKVLFSYFFSINFNM